MKAPVTSSRALAATAELRAAANQVRGTAEPTELNRALVQLLEATAHYWDMWLPETPTAMDTATLLVARAITQTPVLAAGSQSTHH
jgi:hypothetical protein